MAMRREPIATLALIAMLACASPMARAQSLLANGEFDLDVGGWDNPTPPSATWSPMDVDGLATSGSARLTNDDAAAGTRRAVLRQCLALAPGLYRLAVAGWVPQQSVGGRLVVNTVVYLGNACAGGFIASGGYFIPVGAAWQRTQQDVVNSVGAGSGRVEITISIEKDPAGGSFAAQVDAVRLTEIALFVDSFE